KLIVIDPRSIDLVKSPHIQADHHLQLMPGTNVAVLNALAHVIVQENLFDSSFVGARCDERSFADWLDFIRRPGNSPEATAAKSGVPAQTVRAAARLYATGKSDGTAQDITARRPNSAIYYGLGVTEHAQGSTAVMAIANLAMLTGNVGREGVGVNP